MGNQDNSLPLLALADIRLALEEMDIFQEISGTPKAPEEIQVFPAAYYAGGDGAREAADIQHVLYKQDIEYLIFLYVHDEQMLGTISGIDGLAEKLETLIKLTIDKMDSFTKGRFLDNGYLMEVVGRATDNGQLAMTGVPMAAAVITLLGKFPPRNTV